MLFQTPQVQTCDKKKTQTKEVLYIHMITVEIIPLIYA